MDIFEAAQKAAAETDTTELREVAEEFIPDTLQGDDREQCINAFIISFIAGGFSQDSSEEPVLLTIQPRDVLNLIKGITHDGEVAIVLKT